MPNCIQPKEKFCPPEKGTIIRIAIAPQTTINLLGLLELTSPSGICLLVNLPFLSKKCGHDVKSIIESFRDAGGKIEVVE